jgi:hypothetical protein
MFACATVASAFTPTIPPQILSPANGATLSASKPLLIRVDTGDLPNVHMVEILSNGTPIGWADAPDFVGEWSFPNDAHVSVLKPDPEWQDGPPFMIDYHPGGDAPMMFFEGDFVSATQFSGTFNMHSTTPITGNVTVDFTRVNGRVNVVITGDDPVGVRTHTGGEGGRNDRTTFTCAWSAATPGVHNLTARLTYTDTTIWEQAVYITLPVQVTVTAPPAPEVDVRAAGRSLKDNKSSTGFGKVARGAKSTAVTYTIRNVGTAPLKNLKVQVKGAHARDFLITQPGKSRLVPKRETSFKVRFAPRKIGTRKAQLQILSNDADENPFRVALLGTGK